MDVDDFPKRYSKTTESNATLQTVEHLNLSFQLERPGNKLITDSECIPENHGLSARI